MARIETIASLALDAGSDILAAPESRSIEDPKTSWDAVFQYLSAMGLDTYAGRVVGEQAAMQISAVMACTRLIANGVAMLPLLTYRRGDGDARERASEHYLWRLLKDRANPLMTAFRFKRVMTARAALLGNAYAWADVSPNGRVVGLYPWHPNDVRVQRAKDGFGRWTLLYELCEGGHVVERVPAAFMLHIRGLEMDSSGMGLSVIKAARQSMGISLAAEEFGARLFTNGASQGGFIKVPNKLSPEAVERLLSSFNRRHQGVARAHRIGVLEEGMEFVPNMMNPEDLQFLETRTFNVRDIARWFGVPPHMIGELERATFANIEHQSLEYLRDTLQPWLTNWEQEVVNTLLSETESKKIFVEFLPDAMVKTDLKTRYEAYGTGIQNGFLSPNEARGKDNMNPAEGGEQLLVNGNMIPIGQAGQFAA